MLPPIIKVILAVLLFLLISTVGFIYIYTHSDASIKKTNILRASIEKDITVSAKKYMDLMQASQQADADTKRFALLIGTFPPQSKVESLLENITKLGTTAGLKFIYFKPQKPVDYEFYAELPVEISVMGQYLLNLSSLTDLNQKL